MRKKKPTDIIKKTKHTKYYDIINKFIKIGIIPTNNKFIDYYYIINSFKIISNKYLKTIPNKIIENDKIISNQNLIPTKYIHFFNDKYCKPFWNDNIKKMSNNIFLPIEDNINKDLFQTLKFNNNKWFDSKFYISKNNKDELNFTPNKNSFINESLKTRKIAFYPNTLQKKVLRK